MGLYCDLVGSATTFVKGDMGSNPFDPYPRHPPGAAVYNTGCFFNKSAGKGEAFRCKLGFNLHKGCKSQ